MGLWAWSFEGGLGWFRGIIVEIKLDRTWFIVVIKGWLGVIGIMRLGYGRGYQYGNAYGLYMVSKYIYIYMWME